MLRGRRVGTFTAGIVLIMFGVIFLLRLIIPVINFSIILSIWPIILVLLGIEIIVAYIINKEEQMKYDAGAIVLMIILSFFAIVMAGMEFVIAHLSEIRSL
ncbi:MAG: hypothetical protein H7Y18_10185 [Clostridiaceae bacterium]|nr:hypothetical protein [Clostridiaceae bacterium]